MCMTRLARMLIINKIIKQKKRKNYRVCWCSRVSASLFTNYIRNVQYFNWKNTTKNVSGNLWRCGGPGADAHLSKYLIIYFCFASFTVDVSCRKTLANDMCSFIRAVRNLLTKYFNRVVLRFTGMSLHHQQRQTDGGLVFQQGYGIFLRLLTPAIWSANKCVIVSRALSTHTHTHGINP